MIRLLAAALEPEELRVCGGVLSVVVGPWSGLVLGRLSMLRFKIEDCDLVFRDSTKILVFNKSHRTSTATYCYHKTCEYIHSR